MEAFLIVVVIGITVGAAVGWVYVCALATYYKRRH